MLFCFVECFLVNFAENVVDDVRGDAYSPPTPRDLVVDFEQSRRSIVRDWKKILLLSWLQ